MEIQSSHDVEPVAQDNEQFGSSDGRDIENQPPSPVLVLNKDHRNACKNLHHAAMKDEWRVAEAIIKKHPSIVVEKITEEGETVLHVATRARSVRFVGELMKVIMEVSDLEVRDDYGNTAFYYAAQLGFIDIAKAMVERNKNLPNIPSKYNTGDVHLPILAAVVAGYDEAMVTYLLEVTSLDVIDQEQQLQIFSMTIYNEMYDIALNIFNKDRDLARKILESGNTFIIYLLSQKSLAISNQEGKLKRNFSSRFITWLLPKRTVQKQQAGLLLEEVWAECVRCEEDKLLELVRNAYLLHSAAKAGNVEFLAVVIRTHPQLIWRGDNQMRTIFHVAVLHRQEKVFSLIHQIPLPGGLLHLRFDNDGNNILHLAGRLGYYNNNNDIPKLDPSKLEPSNINDKEKIMPASFLRVSGAALQMQREMLWFKEVEKLLPPSHHKFKNKSGKTPRELFTEEHKLLVKEGERWMKDTANSCMLVATLIATVVFAAGFTVPGGNNDNNGIPILLYSNGFRVFVISDAVALFSSIVSIIMFLSILTSRYAEDDFLVSLPTKLFFGLTTLFVSIVSMLLAFTATFFLFYSNHMSSWEPKLIASCAGVPVALFGCLQYKLWFDVAKSTYWSKFHFRSRKYKLY